MYLSELEIVGFKSFAQKTQLKFTSGISAVVGPNGCGKTNIVDAIRWVLGEQKTAVLRSDMMENIIFNGTEHRKPLGMAEVSMVIQNNKQILPIEYDEVRISRRLFRNGESQYLLNNTQCRLRDIVDLFLDTGLGADSYSVIELKMVDALISGKVDERRALFEEAAGIKKYKARRKEAIRKLENVDQDLDRVLDIVDEVRKNVNSLSRQASKTKRYNNHLEQLKDTEIKVLKFDYDKYLSDEKSLISDISNIKSESEKHQRNHDELIKHIDGLKDQQKNLNNQVSEKNTLEASISAKIAELTKDVAVARERISSNQEKEKQANEDIERAIRNSEKLEYELNENQEKLQIHNNKKNNSEIELKTLKEQNELNNNKINELRKAVSKSNEIVFSLQTKIDSYYVEKKNLEIRKRNIENRIESQQNQAKKIKNEIDEIDTKIANVIDEINKLSKNIEAKEAELAKAEQNREKIQEEIERIRRQKENLNNNLSSVKAEYKFLFSLIDTNESSKFLLESNNWQLKSEKLLLVELISTDTKYRVAIEAALGEAANYFVVDTPEDAQKGISELKKHNKGKAAFICRRLIPQIPAPEELNNSNSISWASELCRSDETIKNAVRGLLKGAVITNDLNDAFDAVKDNDIRKAITLKGEIVTKNGVIRGGSELKKEGLKVGKKERIENLQNDIEGLEQKISDIDKETENLNISLKSININQITQQLRELTNELNSNNQQQASYNAKFETLGSNLKMINENSENFQAEITEIQNEIAEISEKAKASEQELVNAQEDYQKRLSMLNDSESQIADENENFRLAEMAYVQLKADIESLIQDISRQKNHKDNLEKTKKIKTEEIKSSKEIVEKLQAELSDNLEKTDSLEKEVAEIKSDKAIINEQKNSIEQQIEQYTVDSKNIQRSIDTIKDKLHEKELSLTQLKNQAKNIHSRAFDQYKIDISEVEIVFDEDFSYEEARNDLQDIRNKLANLGNVNFLALDEYETQKDRLEFYDKQVSDLKESKEILQQTIDEINETAERNFITTFHQIQKNFEILFKKLFGQEGSAEITLSEGNPLESEIKIFAKPPNKRPNSIDQLSGGEKTLTAIALLFAIYLVKPSPFCILDEVDAPLDDANIDKFIDLIKDFSTDTQFLIVTHNKKTMAAADNLYGVTMQENGVSKTVSVKLDNAPIE